MIKSFKTWEEDLIWCPSQCYYYFKTLDNSIYCLYLRWRHEDPWTVEVFKCNEQGEFDFNNRVSVVLTKEYKDSEYKELEKAALDYIRIHYDIIG